MPVETIEKKWSSSKQGFKKNKKENKAGAGSKAIKSKKGGGLFDRQHCRGQQFWA